MAESFSYKQSGVDIDTADATKREMAGSLATSDARVLNRIGAFASLFDGSFPDIKDPVLVLKTEEPGSKQKLAFQYKRITSICYDLINHLINDIIVMGATPLSVQDAIICGKLQKDVVTELVAGISAACREQECVLTGGETSEQPGVIAPGIYILTASIVGVAGKNSIIDGNTIRKGDSVIAVASNGLHTNGYSLVRALIEKDPSILEVPVDGMSFLDAIMLPHTCYYKGFKGLFGNPDLHGMAHITGGGIRDNLKRILPGNVNAEIDLSALRILPVFRKIREVGGVDDDDMKRTFNLGVGATLVAEKAATELILAHLKAHGYDSYVIGEIGEGTGEVTFSGTLPW